MDRRVIATLEWLFWVAFSAAVNVGLVWGISWFFEIPIFEVIVYWVFLGTIAEGANRACRNHYGL